MKSRGRCFPRHLGIVVLWALLAGVLIFSGPALAGPEGTQKWAFLIDSSWGINSSPAIGADGTIYVSTFTSKLNAFNPDGTQKWAFDTGIGDRLGVSSPALDADGTIYVCGGPYLHAVNPDGTAKWAYDFPTSHGINTPAISADGTIYVVSDDNQLYAVNPDGTKKWAFFTGSGGGEWRVFFASYRRRRHHLCGVK